MHEAKERSAMSDRLIYFFGAGSHEGDPNRKDILGGKGASPMGSKPS